MVFLYTTVPYGASSYSVHRYQLRIPTYNTEPSWLKCVQVDSQYCLLYSLFFPHAPHRNIYIEQKSCWKETILIPQSI